MGSAVTVKNTPSLRKRGLAGLRGLLNDDLATHVVVTLPMAPDNPKAALTPGCGWWKTRMKRYWLLAGEVTRQGATPPQAK